MRDGDKFLSSLNWYTTDELWQAGHAAIIDLSVLLFNRQDCDFFVVATQEYFDDRLN